jgi:hypothetical protein
MTAGFAPRKTNHRGVVLAGAFWFDPLLIGAQRLADRVLSLWGEGCMIHSADGGVLLILAVPTLVDSRCAPGVVLTRREGLLMGFPLTENELAQLRPPPGSALLCRGGRVSICPLSRETTLDPAAWLDVNDFVKQTSRPLGDPPPRAAHGQGIEPEPFESHFDPELTRPPDEKTALLNALAEAKSQKGAGAARSRFSLGNLLAWLLRSLKNGKTAKAAAAGKPYSSRKTRPETWLGRQFTLVRRALGSLLLHSPAARFLGRQQARYLEKMAHLFEENNLDQALRYAIPLATFEEMTRAAQSFLPPRPRGNLSISVGSSSGPARLMSLANDYQLYLIELYRRAYERLEQKGEIEKAAFVLLELLKRNEEAIALLERHKKFRFAAEIAQARGLPPGMVIRLWFLAGEPAQAVLVARKTGEFADAVVRLERTHPDEAQKLRIIWAGFLAKAGNYGAAVDAAWRVPEASALILEWINRGIHLEGAIAARLMVKKIAMFPSSREEVLPKIREILRETLPGSLRAKLSLGKAILEHGDQQDLIGLSGFVLRELLKELRAVPFNPGFESVVAGLKRITRDRMLLEDLPSKKFPIPAAGPEGFIMLRRDAADVGLHRLYDGVCLPSGRLIVALGEAGVRVLSQRGVLIAHLDCPADRLVVNDSGNRVIAMARRGEVCRLARIDLETLREHYWCDAPLHRAADTYDGEVWLASHEDTLMAVDALSHRFQSIWQINDLKGPILAMARNSSALSLLVGVADEPEHWTYETPSMTLRQRYGMFKEQELVQTWAVTPKEHYGVCMRNPSPSPGEPDRFFIRIGNSRAQAAWQSREFVPAPASLRLYDHICTASMETAEGQRMLFFRWPGETSTPALQLDLIGARSASIRRYANTFCVVDDCGRVLVIAPENLRVIREAKV